MLVDSQAVSYLLTNVIEIHVDQNFIYKKISTFSVIETNTNKCN